MKHHPRTDRHDAASRLTGSLLKSSLLTSSLFFGTFLLGVLLFAGGCRESWAPTQPKSTLALPDADIALLSEWRSKGYQLVGLSDQTALFVLDALGTASRQASGLVTKGTLTYLGGYGDEAYAYSATENPPGTLTVTEDGGVPVQITILSCDPIFQGWYPNYFRHAHGSLTGSFQARVVVPNRLDVVVRFTGYGPTSSTSFGSDAGCRLTGAQTLPGQPPLQFDAAMKWTSGEATESIEFRNASLKGTESSPTASIEFDEELDSSSGSNCCNPELPQSLSSVFQTCRSVVRAHGSEFRFEDFRTSETMGDYGEVAFPDQWRAHGTVQMDGTALGVIQFAVKPVDRGLAPNLVFVRSLRSTVPFGLTAPVAAASGLPHYFDGIN